MAHAVSISRPGHRDKGMPAQVDLCRGRENGPQSVEPTRVLGFGNVDDAVVYVVLKSLERADRDAVPCVQTERFCAVEGNPMAQEGRTCLLVIRDRFSADPI